MRADGGRHRSFLPDTACEWIDTHIAAAARQRPQPLAPRITAADRERHRCTRARGCLVSVNVSCRAPYLSTTPGLYTVLSKNKFRYDTSSDDDPAAWPRKKDGNSQNGKREGRGDGLAVPRVDDGACDRAVPAGLEQGLLSSLDPRDA
jgi:hypothetical protein